MTGVMGEFRNETIRRLFIGLGVLVALYLGFRDDADCTSPLVC